MPKLGLLPLFCGHMASGCHAHFRATADPPELGDIRMELGCAMIMLHCHRNGLWKLAHRGFPLTLTFPFNMKIIEPLLFALPWMLLTAQWPGPKCRPSTRLRQRISLPCEMLTVLVLRLMCIPMHGLFRSRLPLVCLVPGLEDQLSARRLCQPLPGNLCWRSANGGLRSGMRMLCSVRLCFVQCFHSGIVAWKGLRSQFWLSQPALFIAFLVIKIESLPRPSLNFASLVRKSPRPPELMTLPSSRTWCRKVRTFWRLLMHDNFGKLLRRPFPNISKGDKVLIHCVSCV